MTDKEKLMLEIMGKISNADAPIVFKGAMVTRLILSEYNFDKISRTTRDTDAHWTDSPPTMAHLVSEINRSLGSLQERYVAQSVRGYKEKQSAGISIVDKATNSELFSMDISIKPVYGSRVYYHGDIGIKGVLPDEILADKLAVMSSNRLFQRMKDFIDVYALSHCVNIQTSRILDVFATKKMELQSFDAFNNRITDMKHAYGKLRGVEGKPDFEVIYAYMDKFIRPFIGNTIVNNVWDSAAQVWFDDALQMPQQETEKSEPTAKPSSFMAKLTDANEKAESYNSTGGNTVSCKLLCNDHDR